MSRRNRKNIITKEKKGCRSRRGVRKGAAGIQGGKGGDRKSRTTQDQKEVKRKIWEQEEGYVRRNQGEMYMGKARRN